MHITNQKISGPGKWAPFYGFSFLFDNPGETLTPFSPGFEVMANDETDTDNLKLYSVFNTFIKDIRLDNLNNNYSLCPIPFSAYHVTVWDGLNTRNAPQISRTEELERVLRDIPDSVFSENDFILNSAVER